MKVIIFNDVENFDGSLSLVNKKLEKGSKRFWDFEKYIPFLFEKIKSLNKLQSTDLQLIKTYFYTGKYNSELISKIKWACGNKIKELDNLIRNEQSLLDDVQKGQINELLSKNIENHVSRIKNKLELEKQAHIKFIEKQKRNFIGQREFLLKINQIPFIEMKTTPLKHADGKVYQKGVDVQLATDLVNLAHTGAYDIALILGGDSDLKEAIKLVRKNLGKIVIVIAFYMPGEPLSSTVSDLIQEADHFINLNDFNNEDIVSMSDLLRKK